MVQCHSRILINKDKVKKFLILKYYNKQNKNNINIRN